MIPMFCLHLHSCRRTTCVSTPLRTVLAAIHAHGQPFANTCGQQVFYFTCDCGCEVFFDALGAPWPKHQCRGYLNSLIETYGREVIERGMAVMMMTPGIEPSYARQVQQDYAQEVRQPAPKKNIIRRDPVYGVVRTWLGLCASWLMVSMSLSA